MTSEEKVVAKFNEWLKQLYQTQSAIPDYAMDIVKTQIHKRYGDTVDMNEAKVARILRDIEFVDYYGKEPEIMASLDAKAIPEITPKCKEKMKQLLISMQPAYQKHSRKNNISFNYVMYKLCQQFDQKALLPYLKINISHEKLYRYDRTWHLICDDMKWFFIKSDPTICTQTPQQSPLLLSFKTNTIDQVDRDLEIWDADEIEKLQKGIAHKLTLEQLSIGHNRSMKNIEAKLKSLVTMYHDSKTHDLESIKTLTGLSEMVIVDAISRHELKKNRQQQGQSQQQQQQQQPVYQEQQQQQSPKKTKDEILTVLKDIRHLLQLLVAKP